MTQSSHTMLVTTVMLGQLASAADVDGDPARNLELIREHIAPLTRPLGDRLPILAWQTPNTPTGLELGDVEGVWNTYIERGIMPLCNSMNTGTAVRETQPNAWTQVRHECSLGHGVRADPRRGHTHPRQQRHAH